MRVRVDHVTERAAASAELLAQGWHASFAVRPISSSAAAAQQQQQEQQRKADVRLRQGSEDDAITDQIPLRPMGTVEATSYSVVIIAALGLAGAALLRCDRAGRQRAK